MPSVDPALEELRRRVYAPGATDADRAEYRRLREVADRPEPPDEPLVEPSRPPWTGAPEPAPRARGRRRLLLTAAVGILAVTGMITALVSSADAGPPVPEPTPVSVDPAIRAAFLRNLTAGRIAGIANYLRSERFATPLRDATRYTVVEHWGTGPHSIPIRPAEDVPTAGRATVVLIVRTDGRAGWTLTTLRPYLRADDPSNLLGARAGDAEAGTPTFASVRYRSETVPRTLRVDVPK